MKFRRSSSASLAFLFLIAISIKSFGSISNQLPVDFFPVTPKTNPLLSVAEKLAAIPDNKLDVAYAELSLEKHLWPQLDVSLYLKKIDQIASLYKSLYGEISSPEKRIRSLNTFFYKYMGFDYNRDVDLILSGDYKVSSLSGLLDSKRGTCYSLPILYLAIAQRLGWPVKAVHAPRHMFVRYIDPKLKEQNIETTGFGGHSSDQQYIQDFKITDLAIKNGIYMRTLSNRELLGSMINHHGGHWIHKNLKSKNYYTWMFEVSKSIQLLRFSSKLNPSDESVYINQGNNYNRLSFAAYNVFKEEWGNFPKEKLAASMALMNQDLAASHAYASYAQDWYNIARNNGARTADWTEEWRQEFKDDVEKGRPQAEKMQRQFKRERKAVIDKILNSSKSGGLRLL